MKTELVNIIAIEGIYQLQYYKNFYLAQKKINKTILIIFQHNFLFDSISYLLFFKFLINLLLDLFL